MSKTFLSLIIALSFVGHSALAFSPMDDARAQIQALPSKIVPALLFLKERALRSDGSGAVVRDLSLKTVVPLGIGIAGTGAYLQFARVLGQKLPTAMVNVGTRVVSLGLLGTGVGVAVAVLESSPAQAAEVAEQFKSPEGMARFLSLPLENQAQIAQGDAELAAYVVDLAEALGSF